MYHNNDESKYMFEESELSASTRKQRLVTEEQQENDNEGDRSWVLDQIIILPEIMSMILENLDLRSLKHVRSVCKSWLLETQFHFEHRGIVRLYEQSFAGRSESPNEMYKFLQVCQTKVDELPLPFQSIDVDLNSIIYDQPRLIELLAMHLSNFQPPLLMTRYCPGETPLKLALPFIIQCSRSLEYLDLRNTCKAADDLPQLDPKLTFPKLRRLLVDVADCRNNHKMRTDFLNILSWIMGASPNLEEYESYARLRMKTVNESSDIVLNVDISDMKRLTLVDYFLCPEALKHFLAIPFSKLEHLRISIYSDHDQLWCSQALVQTMAKCAATTLRILDLSNIPDPEQRELANFGFPVCPTVKELKLEVFPNSKNFLTTHFPFLQELSVFCVIERYEPLFEKLTPFFGLKAFRTQNIAIICNAQQAKQNPEIQFFENFPTLERLSVQQGFLNKCCGMKATGNPKYDKLLDGVKHLELEHYSYFDVSSLRFFKGIKTVEMTPPSNSVTFDFFTLTRFPPLKVFAFPWTNCCNEYELQQLLEMAKKVETVVITNCCSISRGTSFRKTLLLEAFFKSTSNTVCGCNNLTKNQLLWK